jgi:hypothetical protein
VYAADFNTWEVVLHEDYKTWDKLKDLLWNHNIMSESRKEMNKPRAIPGGSDDLTEFSAKRLRDEKKRFDQEILRRNREGST